ncbi:histidinol-phosphate aminotransferase [Mobilisporobacter senegalensis]|uniref:Histidinol-phosphate aminotransferase n=1 Tax=Mobilisporobacter senegalensis TaxID=1329262 RepID=A0A3N1XPH9_9FIRM|nr:histidinol-phosphate transaminase [Mobilisporobacter senegalensis]ROR28599.1 histidinol-phosphate aminotransferase [Mobilisporobacter senegalensis]
MKSWKENIRRIDPYVPGEQPDLEDMIKLNTNENPYPPAPGIIKAMKEFDFDKLRLYPDPTASMLTDSLAKYYHVDKEQVFVGVGSDDVLAMAFLTFFNSKKPILFPDITYSFYEVWANLYKIPYERPQLDDNFKINKEDYYKKNGGVVIANPNAPTGIYENLEFIEEILLHNQNSVVIVDEAYIDFGGESAVRFVEKYENLLVVQTFSKSRSMAGMRIGFAIGHKDLIKALNDVKYSYNSYTMNQVSLCFGVPAIEDDIYFKETLKRIIDTRERTKVELKNLGFSFPDSMTNFIFATHPQIKAIDIFRALREKNIFVRHFNLSKIDNYLRISIGTDEEMDKFISALKEILC